MLAAALVIASLAVDQVGYPAHAPKIAIVSSSATRFTLTRDGKIVYQGALTEPQFDPDTRDRVSVADFSSVTVPGRYEIHIEEEVSTINIADDPYSDLRRLTARAFTGQRCGTAVDLGGGFAHPACHTSSKVTGGWHDAGDYGRYVVNSAITMATLLWTYELYRVDLRDEVRWNLDWMMKMQDADGSVWHKETSRDFAAFVMPQDDHSEQLLIGKSSCAAADFAAVAAIASRVYNSHAYLDASKRAWQWVSAHPDVTFKNPPGVKTGEYGDSDCSDERLWAAAELVRASGDAEAASYFAAHAQQAIDAVTPSDPPDWRHVGALAAWSYAMSGRGDPSIAARIREKTIAAADAIVERTRKHAYRIPMQTRDYVWGSNGVAANYALQLLCANEMHRDRAYVDAATEVVHYLLGRNPFSLSWVTGTGTASVQHPHHRPSVADGIIAPWPGLLAGGPNANRQDPVLRRLPRDLPPALAYVDDTESFSSNEIAINWNAPLLFTLAAIRDTVPTRSPPLRVVVFRASGFPTVDAPVIPQSVLDEALAGFDVTTDLRDLQDARLLVLPYGSAFPLEAWPQIRDFVKRGGNLVVLGGAPFAQPVLRTLDGWKKGVREPAFAHEFLIGPAEAVKFDGRTVWELTIRLGTEPQIPSEQGSQARVESFVRPLELLRDGDGIPRACPLVEIDHEHGGRWIFATSDQLLSAPKIRDIIARALLGEPALPAHTADVSTKLPPAPRLTVSRDWMRRDGKVFPVVGTTYMASDVHRDFLFDPHPDVWERDFALMERIGINLVRTGLWSGWAKADDEKVLEALDAFVAAAARHNIVVCFTFFAFQPPWYGGTNPFLDPRSVMKQTEFVTKLARRYRGNGWVQYDLINEPSYAPADKLWSNRPIGDESEAGEWAAWVRQRHGDDVSILRDLWHEAGDDVLAIRTDNPRKAYDFTVFTNGAVAAWAGRLAGMIKREGGDPLVTLGQDEGGAGTRPSQQLHAESIDYTATHPWWQNDDVLANGLFAKVPEKPMFFQETGLMRLEDANGNPWRTPERAADLLDRKFAYAFMSRGAGAIEWAWNINPYMPIDNEAVIGLFRPDGTAKPELDVVRKFAAFFREAAPYLDDFAPDPVVVVIPQSRLFMGRPNALDGYRRLIRVLAERFAIVPAAISDLRLTDERLRDAKLVIVPSAEFLDSNAAGALGVARARGTRILFTGAITGDPYGHVPLPLKALGVVDRGRPVRMHEGSATFDRDLQESLLRSTLPASSSHEPLPLEFAREDEPLVHLLAKALGRKPYEKGVAMRVLEAPRARLVIAVNETNTDARRHIAGIDITIPAGRSTLVLVDRKTSSEITRR